ncbi:hypothetical protein EKO04_000105 [Ascochyta lentis]|uniref:F-box domain-containing protein n=1 Tax=Ascochyta lentis TaxID=205686 RepID=A0A8H7JD68_9PLEO|nr:hypothetical protein EKO04_000105 [Ascochyta lentis]
MGLNALPNELLLEVCRYLSGDPASLSALARVSRKIQPCAFEVLMNNCTIDLSSGDTQIIHNVMAHLFSLAHNVTVPPPNVAIESTGSLLVDDLVKHASKFKTLKLCVADRHGITSTVSGPVLTKYMSAVQVLERATMYGAKSWKSKFTRGKMEDLLRFLLRVTRHIYTLEMESSLYWMGQTEMKGMCPALHTLKLVGITNKSLSRNCCYFVRLPTLRQLEFARMSLTHSTLLFLGTQLYVTTLRFVDCWVATMTLGKAIRACRTLETFEYSLSAEHCPQLNLTVHQYSLYDLISVLATNHKDTLKHLTILDLDAQVGDLCHEPDALSQFTVLKTLAINHDHLHPRRVDNAHATCSCYRLAYITPATVLLSLPPSLQKLELQVCNKTFITGTLLDVLQNMQTAGALPNLCTVKTVFERTRAPPSDEERQVLRFLRHSLNGRGRSRAMQDAALRVPRVQLVQVEPALVPQLRPSKI